MSGPADQANTVQKRLLVGRIGAAHGIKGEVRVQAFTEEPMTLKTFGPLATDRRGVTIEIEAARGTTNMLVARLKGITTRTEAEKLNGLELYIDRSVLPTIENEDDFYQADLLDLEARNIEGQVIGKVTAIPNFGAGDLLEITDPATGASKLYPFTKAAVPEIAIADGYLVIVPPTEIDGEIETGDTSAREDSA